MASFQEMLKQEQARTSNNNFGDRKVEYPNNALKHDMLYFSKDNSTYTVRILPGTTEAEPFAVQFKEQYFQTTNKNGKTISLPAIIGVGDTPENSKLLANYNTWVQQERVPNRYNSKAPLSTRYFVNVVQVFMDGNGNLVHETDQNGELVVRVLKLPQSAYTTLINKLTDPMLMPNGAGEQSFISPQNAYPVRITKPEQGSQQMSYGIDVYSNKELGALPDNWADYLEDLEYQATPTEQYNSEFVEYFISVVNGMEGQGQSEGQQPQQGGAPQQSGFPQAQNAPQGNGGFTQAPPQQNSGFQTPPQQSNGFGTPPSQNQGGFGSPTGGQPQTSPQQNSGFQAPPTQPQAQQGGTSQGGAGQQTPTNGGGNSNGFPNPPQNNQEPTQQQAPTNNSQEGNNEQTQTLPSTPTQQNGAPQDVSNIIAEMTKNVQG